MEKPQPKTEIVITRPYNSSPEVNPNYLDIHVSSDRAGRWLNQVRWEFEDHDGDIDFRLYKPGRTRFYVVVNPCFDVGEVIAYLTDGPPTDFQ